MVRRPERVVYEGVAVGCECESVRSDEFGSWYSRYEPRLLLALTATYGPERGREAAAEAMAWAWEHRDRLDELHSPVGFLYRVGQSRTRLRRIRVLHGRSQWAEPWFEPQLGRALSSLSEKQRIAVVLVHGYGWTFTEVGEVLGVKVTTVQNHLERGLTRLRSLLEVSADD